MRGNGFERETASRKELADAYIVSVPVRGNGFERLKTVQHVYLTAEEFPSP